jgi:hypothetical protein
MKALRALVILAALLMGLSVDSAAQTVTSVGVGQAFTIGATPPVDGAPTFLRFYIDGAAVGDVAVSGAGDTLFVVGAGLSTSGNHRIEASALNDAGEGPKAGIDLWVGVPPAPGLPRIIVSTQQVFEQVEDASGITLRLVSTSTQVAKQ